MKETGIIMSGNHPQLILDGVKTMTRRMINPQPPAGYIYKGFQENPLLPTESGHYWMNGYAMWRPKQKYEVGDRLWVREGYYTESGDVWYKADGQTAPMLIKWKPSIFMPRWASRILLEITKIRVERLQEISESDVEREGTPMVAPRPSGVDINDFKYLWNKINAKRGYGWETNPWVWVISFRRISG